MNEIVDAKADLSNEIVNVKTGLSCEIVDIKSDTNLIKADMVTFRSNLSKVEAAVVKVDNKIEIVNNKVDREVGKVKGDIKLVSKKVDSHENHIIKLEENFEDLKTEVETRLPPPLQEHGKDRTMNILTDN